MTKFSGLQSKRDVKYNGTPNPMNPNNGDFYFDNAADRWCVFNGNQWWFAAVTTTTSTSSSTTTTSTSTTSTSSSTSTSVSTSTSTTTSTTTTL